MSAVLWVLVSLAYLAVGVGLARLRARHVMQRIYNQTDLKYEMVCWMFLWPMILPCFLVVVAIRWALFPRRIR